MDNDLRFMRPLLSKGEVGSEAGRPDAQARTPEAVCQAVAAVMAYGCNLDPVAMARLTTGVTYPQIKRITD